MASSGSFPTPPRPPRPPTASGAARALPTEEALALTQELPVPPSASPWHQNYRPHHWLMMVIAWPLVAFCAWFIWVRYGEVGDSLTIALVGLFPFLVLPVTAAVGFAVLSRSKVLQVASALVAFAFVVTVNPFDAVIGCGSESTDDEISVLTANVLAEGGASPEAIAQSILTYDPDIVVLQEVRWTFFEQLSENPRLANYAYRSTDVADIPYAVWIMSRFPITEVVNDGFVAATIETDSGPLRLHAIHTLAPSVPINVETWLKQYRTLSAVSTATPQVMAGDFNATDDHHPFRNLLGQGWTDVHNNKGCGFDATWPTKQLPFPVYRLDHVLVTDHFKPLSVQMLPSHGSDHKPVLATFRPNPDYRPRTDGAAEESASTTE